MTRATSTERHVVAEALTLFFGAKPLLVLPRQSATSTAEESMPAQGSAGTVIVHVNSPCAADHPLPDLLADCHRALRPGGRVAVLFANSAYRSLKRLRSRLRGPRDSLADNPDTRAAPTPGLRQVLRALRDAQFENLAVYGVTPSTNEPGEIQPFSLRSALTSPAFLVVGKRDGSGSGFLLEQIIERIDRSIAPEGHGSKGRLLLVKNSPRGKSVAIIRSGGRRIVVRIPRFAIAHADEAIAHRLLQELQENPAVATRVPRPLLADSVDGHKFLAESHLDGSPLADRITNANRSSYVREVSAFLKALNPDLRSQPTMPIAGGPAETATQPMLERVLSYVPDASLRASARELFDDSIRGASSRLGIVHGDFGVNNILVTGRRVTGVIDWEAARRDAPPILDAFNYLDSVHRRCSGNLTIVDTLPMLAAGEWPVPEELDFLRDSFEYCGIDFRWRKAFALLYFLHHVGPQLRFSKVDDGPLLRLEQVLRHLTDEAGNQVPRQ